MKIWITTNTRFGYKYTTDPNSRTNILKSVDWLYDILNQKSSPDDVLLISGGLFSNTNPSLIAIDDAQKALCKLSEKILVHLINTSRDVKKFDGELYSTLNLINLLNVHIERKDVYNKYLDLETNKFNNIDIPNLVQLDETDGKPGVLVFNTNISKHIFLENNSISKHINIHISTFDELKNLDKDFYKNHIVHLTIKSSVFEHKEADIEVFKLNPVSIKYIETEQKREKEKIIDFTTDIKQMILNHIESDEKMVEQFNRILSISKN